MTYEKAKQVIENHINSLPSYLEEHESITIPTNFLIALLVVHRHDKDVAAADEALMNTWLKSSKVGMLDLQEKSFTEKQEIGDVEFLEDLKDVPETISEHQPIYDALYYLLRDSRKSHSARTAIQKIAFDGFYGDKIRSLNPTWILNAGSLAGLISTLAWFIYLLFKF